MPLQGIAFHWKAELGVQIYYPVRRMCPRAKPERRNDSNAEFYNVLSHIKYIIELSNLMVGPQVVDLFFEDRAPKFFTQELHYVQVIFESGAVFCKSFQKHMQY